MGAIYRREIGAFFSSAIAYIFLGVFYFFSAFFFSMSCLYSATTDMSTVFSSMFMVILFLIPILTMRLMSEEKKQKTEQGLLTAPVSLTEIVYGKYLSAITLYAMGIVIFFVYALILAFFGTVSWSLVLANCVALFLLGGAFIAVAMFISALTENQIVAAIGGICVLLLLYLLDSIASAVSWEWLSTLLDKLSFYTRYYEFTQGLFDLSSVLFYVSVIVLFNFFTIRVFERRRWS
jgi:ABC-2 type transport system permease protein